MYKLNLPIDYCATGCTKITINADGTADGFNENKLDPDAALKNTELVYQNVSKVIWSALAIEKLMNRIIINHYFTKDMFKQSFDFNRRFIESGALSFNVKRRVVFGIAKDNIWVKGEAKSQLDKDLAKVEKYRNAFAHGQVTCDMKNGQTITYFRGNIRKKPITDDFWHDIEKHYSSAFISLKGFLENHQGDKIQHTDYRDSSYIAAPNPFY